MSQQYPSISIIYVTESVSCGHEEQIAPLVQLTY